MVHVSGNSCSFKNHATGRRTQVCERVSFITNSTEIAERMRLEREQSRDGCEHDGKIYVVARAALSEQICDTGQLQV